MEFGIFKALEHILGLYAIVAVAWVGAIVADLVVNKPLGLSPPHIEFKRAHLYDINPVGVGAMLIASALSIAAYSDLFGDMAQAFSSFIALGTAFVTAPIIAFATGGKYYLARTPRMDATAGARQKCCICEYDFETEDMAYCPIYSGPICSLCCSLDARCHDGCKVEARLQQQIFAVPLRLPAGDDRCPARLPARPLFRADGAGVRPGRAVLRADLPAGDARPGGAEERRVGDAVERLFRLRRHRRRFLLAVRAGDREPARGAGGIEPAVEPADPRDPRAPAHRRAAQEGEGGGRGRQRGQEPLHGRHQPRASHAAQHDHGLCPDPRARPRAAGAPRGFGARDPAQRRAPRRADRGVARYLEDRGRPAQHLPQRVPPRRLPEPDRRHVPHPGRVERASTSSSAARRTCPMSCTRTSGGCARS